MASYVHPNALDDGLNLIRTTATRLLLISSYAPGDSYATVTGRILAAAAVTSANFALSSVGLSRRITSAAGISDTGADANGGGANSHLAFVDDTNSRVLWVTPETTQQTVVAGNPVAFPSVHYTALQPVVV